eukprot:TRINITY_DN60264_c0_g1_i1.p1 TRINITY_DN60264_c0_g1~~TRINITY_DN60264_c0_g1_i1.p1  ORF type:complete len:987 (+),score=335.46 TRINITY_DN60264_c0_g1_i1:125-3085(+)
MARHIMQLLAVAAALCSLFMQPAEAAATAVEGVELEPLPDGLWITDNVITLACAWGFLGLMFIIVIAMIAGTGGTKLPLLILTLQLTAVLAAGICTWIVTYTAAREAIEDHTNNLLIFAGLTASSRTTADLGAGVLLCQNLWEDVIQKRLDLTAGFPGVHQALLTAESTVGKLSSTISGVYLGNELGEIHGVERVSDTGASGDGDSAVSQKVVGLWVGVGPATCRGGSKNLWERWYGTQFDYCNNRLIELRCGTNADPWGSCQHKACADQVGNCKWCLTNRGAVDGGREDTDCPGCAQCDSYVPPTFEAYTVSRDFRDWDLPDTAGKVAGMCYPAGDELLAAHPSPNYNQGYFPNGTAGRRWGGGLSMVGSGGCSSFYDPRIRPWYARNDGVTWSSVYEFAATGAVIEMGITVTLAVRNPRYNGALYTSGVPPNLNDDPWTAVMAIDYSFSSISRFLPTLVPTKNSVVLIADLDGLLCAGSLKAAEMSERVVQDDGKINFKPINVSKPGNWNRTDLFHVYPRIINKYGSLRDAHRTRAILQGSPGAVLNQPLDIRGGLKWIMAINTPYADITEESEDATTIALILAVVISIGSGLLVGLLVALVLAPLHQLSQQMHDVAMMDLDDLEPMTGGITIEVRQMVSDFVIMVASLKQFREYMPQTALMGSDDEEDDGPQKANSKGSLSQSATSPQGAGKRGSAILSTSQSNMSVSQRSAATKRQIEDKKERLQAGVLKSKSITIIMFNLLDFIKTASGKLQDAINTHNTYISTVLSLIKKHKGVPETFAGDRMMIHFNAMGVCTGHCVKACAVACETAATDVGNGVTITAGIAMGRAFCGNLGVEGMKRFSIVGACVPAANFYSMIGKTRPQCIQILVDEAAKKESDKQFYFKSATRLAYAKLRVTPFTLHQLMQAKTASEDEWMYQLEQAEKDDPYAEFNKQFFDFFSAGKTPDVPAGDAYVFQKAQSSGLPATEMGSWTENILADGLL